MPTQKIFVCYVWWKAKYDKGWVFSEASEFKNIEAFVDEEEAKRWCNGVNRVVHTKEGEELKSSLQLMGLPDQVHGAMYDVVDLHFMARLAP